MLDFCELIKDEQIKCKIIIKGKKFISIDNVPPYGIMVIIKTKDDNLMFAHTKKISELNLYKNDLKDGKKEELKEYSKNNNRNLVWFEFFSFVALPEYEIKGYYKM